MPRQLLGTAIASNTITTTQLQTTVVNQISAGGGPRVSSLIYPGDDTAANTAGGQTVYVVGSGFAANANVYINGNAVPSISFISASNLAITTPALSAATYPVYVINPETGATAIHIPGLRVSGDPSWVTASGSLAASQDEGSAWSYTVSATSDSAVTYALAGGSSLPSGISLAANGLISGTLSSPPGTETTYNFTVVATDAENQNASRAFSVTVSSGEGVLFANNVLLIHADGTNNQNNHTFLDSSNNNFTITRSGNTSQGSFSPFSQTGWSNYFDGSGDRLTIADNTALRFGTGDFTVEFWMYADRTNAYMRPIGTGSTEGGTWSIILNNDATFTLAFATSGVFSSAISYSANIWQHIAIIRSGSTVSCFVNGVRQQTTTSSYDLNAAASTFIGYSDAASSQVFLGHISNVRLVKGTAVYNPSLTTLSVPTSPLTAISGTSLLTCQSNRIRDASNNNFTITRNGDVSVQPFSPFAPTAAYTTANVGGSLYLDGNGDYLTIPDNAAFDLGSGDFTMECWAYTNAFASQYNVLASQWGNSSSNQAWIFRITSSLIGLYANISGTANYTASVTNTTGTWDHFAITRSSGTLTFWKNGTNVGTASISGTITNAGDSLAIGVLTDFNSTTLHNGYISGLRIIKGNSIYTANSAPPTSPPTNIANTSLLCNFTNAGIFDQTAKNIIETVGDAKVSTAQYKYGTGSIYLNGDNNYLISRASNLYSFGSGNFTVEMWLYVSSSGSNQCVIDFRNAGDTNGIFLRSTSSTNFEIRIGNSSIHTFTATAGQFNHIAIVRSSGTIKSFVNGVETGSTSNSTNLTSQGPLCINRFYDLAAGIVGYIDDLRITKGYARYTSNFTAPTSAFKDK